MNRCIVCRRPYYRRNLSIVWVRTTPDGQWKRDIRKGHPECLRLYSSVSKLFRRSVA